MSIEVSVPLNLDPFAGKYYLTFSSTSLTYTDLDMRKLWERLILRRITSGWDAHSILNEAQHCRSDRGCSAALLHFQAVLETAQETGTDVYMSSWDAQRAYDSTFKTDIKLAWMRLGLPPHISDYLISTDCDG